MGYIYFLISGVKIVYVGQTINLTRRLREHSNKAYDSMRFIECDISVLKKYESRLINFFKPVYNKYPGKLSINDKLIGFSCRIDADLLHAAKEYARKNHEIGGLSGLIRRLLAKEIGFKEKE